MGAGASRALAAGPKGIEKGVKWLGSELNAIHNTWTVEGLRGKVPGDFKSLISFASSNDVAKWKLECDSDVGGKSAATVSYNAKENALVLEGNLNTECTTWKMKKSGYAAIISPHWDPPKAIDEYNAIELVVRSDGRPYFFSMKPDTFFMDDIYQTPFATPKNEWTRVIIPYDRFYLTQRNLVDESFPEMDEADSRRIVYFGIMMAQRKDGPFKLELKRARAIIIDDDEEETETVAHNNIKRRKDDMLQALEKDLTSKPWTIFGRSANRVRYYLREFILDHDERLNQFLSQSGPYAKGAKIDPGVTFVGRWADASEEARPHLLKVGGAGTLIEYEFERKEELPDTASPSTQKKDEST
eukprot:TRINITY_DN2224_c0_g1_i1.p1 TRINITY_DN2224_c0_g1~~TRINITY_DN2224_c0_g1_i1.p1  ORF type:complete len:357 (+),score=78.38 TRINITY_DN2224_c0_g1_i1:184-1254(+)